MNLRLLVGKQELLRNWHCMFDACLTQVHCLTVLFVFALHKNLESALNFFKKLGCLANLILFFCLGVCVWKAKNNSIGSNTIALESQLTKVSSDSQPPDTGPGKSFRNFRFDTAAILQAMEAGFCN